MNSVHVAHHLAGGRVRCDLSRQERAVGEDRRARPGLSLLQRVRHRSHPLRRHRDKLTVGLPGGLGPPSLQVRHVIEKATREQISAGAPLVGAGAPDHRGISQPEQRRQHGGDLIG